jgi:hypothetical protein
VRARKQRKDIPQAEEFVPTSELVAITAMRELRAELRQAFAATYRKLLRG